MRSVNGYSGQQARYDKECEEMKPRTPMNKIDCPLRKL